MNANDLARRVAPHLPGWRHEENDNDYVGILKRPDGATIHLRIDNKRIKVSGSYPADECPYMTFYPTITVSATRTPQAIAADIARRFLPEYDALYAQAVAIREQEQQSNQQKINDTQRLAKLLGLESQLPRDLENNPHLHLSWVDPDVYCSFRTEHSKVYLDRASMPIALFERLVAVIAAWIEEQRALVRSEQ